MHELWATVKNGENKLKQTVFAWQKKKSIKDHLVQSRVRKTENFIKTTPHHKRALLFVVYL